MPDIVHHFRPRTNICPHKLIPAHHKAPHIRCLALVSQVLASPCPHIKASTEIEKCKMHENGTCVRESMSSRPGAKEKCETERCETVNNASKVRRIKTTLNNCSSISQLLLVHELPYTDPTVS